MNSDEIAALVQLAEEINLTRGASAIPQRHETLLRLAEKVRALVADRQRLRDALAGLVDTIDEVNADWDAMTEDERSEGIAHVLAKRHIAKEALR